MMIQLILSYGILLILLKKDDFATDDIPTTLSLLLARRLK